MAAYRPLQHPTELPEGRLYTAAEGALLDLGNNIEKRDPVELRLETKPRTLAGSAIQQDGYRYFWIVDVDEGEVRIEIHCERVRGQSASDCGDKRPQKLVTEQKKLLEAILRDAGQ